MSFSIPNNSTSADIATDDIEVVETRPSLLKRITSNPNVRFVAIGSAVTLGIVFVIDTIKRATEPLEDVEETIEIEISETED